MITRTLIIATIAAPAFAASPRELYNEGVARMAKNELREAESALRDAARANHAAVQPVALYNLGHVRFLQGRETLKGEGNRQQLLDSADAAGVVAQEAIQRGKEALESDQLQQIIGAYMEGRAARKQLRVSRDETTRQLDLLGSALARWRRSVGDFRGAAEMDPANTDAGFNADTVERHIDALLKFKEKLEQQAKQTGESREKMKEMMKALRGKIPKEMMQQDDGEEDDEDEEEEKQPEGKKPEDQVGKKQQQRIGNEREVSPEMAQWLKETLKRRTMSLGTGEEKEGGKEGEQRMAPGNEQQKPGQRRKDW